MFRFFDEDFQIKAINYMVDIVLPKLWEVAKILIFVLIVKYLADGIINKIIKSMSAKDEDGLSSRVKRIETLSSLIRSILFYILVFIAGVMILRVFDIDPAPVLTAAGVVGLAVGFGAQKLVRDIIAGFFILMENQYSVGDYVTIGAVTGVVVELGMRITKVRDDIGKLVYISNGDIAQVVNHSRGTVRMILDINIAPDSDLEQVRKVIDDTGIQLTSEMAEIATPPKSDGITAISAGSITLRITGDVRAGSQEVVQMALREKILEKSRDGLIKVV